MRRNQIVFSLVAFLLIGFGAIGIVWMRLGISDIAAECAVLEDQREVLLREVQELRGQRSWAMRPSVLASLVEGRLKMGVPERTIHVSRKEMLRRVGGKRGQFVVGDRQELAGVNSLNRAGR